MKHRHMQPVSICPGNPAIGMTMIDYAARGKLDMRRRLDKMVGNAVNAAAKQFAGVDNFTGKAKIRQQQKAKVQRERKAQAEERRRMRYL